VSKKSKRTFKHNFLTNKKGEDKLKKLSALFLAAVLVFAISGNTYSQPKFTINVTGGYSLPLPDLKGDFPDSVGGIGHGADSNSYYIKNGFNFGLVGKYAIGKKGNFRVTGGVNVNLFSQSKDYTDSAGAAFTVKNKMNIIGIFLGAEWAFLPKRAPGKIVNPFLGLDVTANLFSGSVEGVPGISKMDLKSAARFGIGVGGGIDFAFSQNVGAVVGAKYNLANLVGKEYDSTQTTATQYALDDKEHTVGSTTYSARNIQFIHFYAGVSFYLGQPKKKVSK